VLTGAGSSSRTRSSSSRRRRFSSLCGEFIVDDMRCELSACGE
jgi:hypothetical protein